jgi:hypothetical protein
MRIAGTIVGIILVLLGGIWMAQGSNLLAGSVMSGQNMWLWIGVAVALIGLIVLVWTNRRR